MSASFGSNDITHLEFICDTMVASVSRSHDISDSTITTATTMINFWNTTTLKYMFSLDTSHDYSINALKFIPSMMMLVSGHSDGKLKFWNLNKSGKNSMVWEKSANNGKNNIVYWSFELIDRDILVAASENNIEFWNLSSNRGQRPELVDHFKTNVPITALSMNAFSNDYFNFKI